MRRLWASAGAVLVALAASSAAVAACDTKNAIFQDSFDILDPSWGEGADLKVENGQILLAPGAQYYRWVPSSAGIYDDVDVCVTAKTVAAINPLKTMAGIVFWYQDNQNLYVFEYAANGNAAVYRQQRGKWISPVGWQPAPGLKQGDGAVNELRVVTVGNRATFYVNGQQFKQINGSPPTNGQQVGLFAASFDESTPTYGFEDFVVSNPLPAADAAAPAGTASGETAPASEPVPAQ
jgi:hypothetical protein